MTIDASLVDFIELLRDIIMLSLLCRTVHVLSTDLEFQLLSLDICFVT